MLQLLALLAFLSVVFAPVGKAADKSASKPEAAAPVARERAIMGWLESIYLKPWNKRLTAKLDTGAKTSSLHAGKVERFSKAGESWVRFTLDDLEDADSDPIMVERPLVRTAYIKSHQREVSKRDVVLLTICKNGNDYPVEFNLVDRSKFNYLVLLGRSLLKDLALVDASATFLFKAEKDPCIAPKVDR